MLPLPGELCEKFWSESQCGHIKSEPESGTRCQYLFETPPADLDIQPELRTTWKGVSSRAQRWRESSGETQSISWWCGLTPLPRFRKHSRSRGGKLLKIKKRPSSVVESYKLFVLPADFVVLKVAQDYCCCWELPVTEAVLGSREKKLT